MTLRRIFGTRQILLNPTGITGEKSGLATQTPTHTHAINCIDGARLGEQSGQPTNAILVKTGGTPANAYTPGTATQNQTVNASMVAAAAGGNQPHNNMMPYLTLNFCIALQGIFPTRG